MSKLTLDKKCKLCDSDLSLQQYYVVFREKSICAQCVYSVIIAVQSIERDTFGPQLVRGCLDIKGEK